MLDRRLQKEAMPDRDTWWSTYLHRVWGSRTAVDRLVDWASSVGARTAIEEDVVDLAAITLSWMLGTSNRFLRDRATKCLVELLTGRMAAMLRLVNRFADVDDPYIRERVYSVAYGVAMRCRDGDQVKPLGLAVYESVFAAGTPPPHILLRDYARGVVERAVYLAPGLPVDLSRVRPPYGSQWPRIPTEAEIQSLIGDLPGSSDASGELGWGARRIVDSVMNDDFAWYVIGTNGGWPNWLALRLAESTERERNRFDLG